MKNNQKVKITKDGPYEVTGGVPLDKEIAVVGESGEPEEWRQGEKYPVEDSYFLCRCGRSKNKPFCDQSHVNNFMGKETADKASYLARSLTLSGPELDLIDITELCSSARFCHLAGGTWENVKKSNDPEAKRLAIQTACNCPSGRLTVRDKKARRLIEPELKPSIGVTEDPQAGVSGPLRLKGRVKLVSADGQEYSERNRMTLCRCGKSRNKPFCDSSHLGADFNDGDASLKSNFNK